MSDIASWAFLIGVLLVLALPLALAIASLWLWGGARRGALGHLMAGALLLVTGAIFIYVTWINVFARMDDLWSWDNTGFGEYFMLLGVILLIGSLAGYGVHPWLVALLVVASEMFGIFGVSWLANVAAFPNGEELLYAALLLGGVLLYITLRGYFIEAIIAVTLTTLVFALVWRIAGGEMRAFTPVTIVAESTSTSRLCSTLATYSSASSPRPSSSSPGASSRASCANSERHPSLRTPPSIDSAFGHTDLDCR